MFLACLLFAHLVRCAFNEDTASMMNQSLFSFNQANDSDDESVLTEEWVHKAVLDVAYYLRSHKFNEFDRRFQTEDNAVRNMYIGFPEPPLKSFHWDVHGHCSTGFISCLRYLSEVISESAVSRTTDTSYLIRRFGWDWQKNKDKVQILKADEECRRLFDMDWQEPEPFMGPLQRFQFRATASYYMCLFTMQGHPELSTFGEPCDNFAGCLFNNNQYSTNDPRADDFQPFYCALYSFCPDPCCPMKQIKNILECQYSPGNPCNLETNDEKRECRFNRQFNDNLDAVVKNNWNTSCDCNEKGFTWESRFGMCVDIDECQDRTDGCDRNSETCFNLRGSYGCACSTGRWWDHNAQACIRVPALKANLNVSLAATNQWQNRKKKPVQQKLSFLHDWKELKNITLLHRHQDLQAANDTRNALNNDTMTDIENEYEDETLATSFSSRLAYCYFSAVYLHYLFATSVIE